MNRVFLGASFHQVVHSIPVALVGGTKARPGSEKSRNCPRIAPIPRKSLTPRRIFCPKRQASPISQNGCGRWYRGCGARGCPAATIEVWLDGHVPACAFFGTVPQSILHDNDRCLEARIMPDGTGQRTRRFSAMLSYHVIQDRYGRPGKGNDKGKVEGLFGCARRNFMVPMPRFREWFEAEGARPPWNPIQNQHIDIYDIKGNRPVRPRSLAATRPRRRGVASRETEPTATPRPAARLRISPSPGRDPIS